ncbi:MAG: hypothetical protein AAF664_20715 [Planctomycetota bacterium]
MLVRIFLLICLVASARAYADMEPPSVATAAVSPNGRFVVRLHEGEALRFSQATAVDAYKLEARFKVVGEGPQFIFVSDSADILFVYLDERTSIQLYDLNGQLRKTWSLNELLTQKQIGTCMRTGATIQWLDEAAFFDRRLAIRGPSCRVRCVASSYTLMSRGDPDAQFAFAIDCKTPEVERITMDENTEP